MRLAFVHSILHRQIRVPKIAGNFRRVKMRLPQHNAVANLSCFLLVYSLSVCYGLRCLECVGHASFTGNCSDASTCEGQWCATTYLYGGKSGAEFVHKTCLSDEENKLANDTCLKILEFGIIDQFTCTCQSADLCNEQFNQATDIAKNSIEASITCFDCSGATGCEEGSCIGRWCTAALVQTNGGQRVEKTCALAALPGTVAAGCIKVNGREQYLCTCNSTFCNSDYWLQQQISQSKSGTQSPDEILSTEGKNKTELTYFSEKDSDRREVAANRGYKNSFGNFYAQLMMSFVTMFQFLLKMQ